MDNGEIWKGSRVGGKTAGIILSVIHVRIDGKYYLLDGLSEEKRKRILAELNDRGMRSIGYIPVGKKSDSA